MDDEVMAMVQAGATIVVVALMAILQAALTSRKQEVAFLSPLSHRRAGKMRMVAHRGSSHTAPENTLASLSLAFRQGACGVEFDIQKSSDGELFLLHDDTLRRTAAPGCPCTLEGLSQEEYEVMLDQDISQLSYRDFIRHVDVGTWKLAEYAGERPCLMTDAMATLPAGCFALCEVKGGDKATAHAVTTLAKEKGWTGDQLTFIGFDLELMTEIKQRLLELDMGAISVIYVQDAYDEEKAMEVIRLAKAAGLDGVDFEADLSVVTPAVVSLAAASGLQTGVWVWPSQLPKSDTHPTAAELERCGVNFFTTDLPPAMQDWICTC